MNLDTIYKVLEPLGFTLEVEQPHINGERFLMAKDKLVLVAKYRGERVIIKISNTPDGQKDIQNEKQARDLLKSISFANKAIHFPEERYWGEKDDYTIWAIEFIEQEKIFVNHTLEEQFFLILKALEEQESFHATTYEHLATVKKIFPIMSAQDYFKEFSNFRPALEEAQSLLRANKSILDKYSGYLTHTDFVPHNFRIRHREIYMLDCAPEVRTVHFGNKYEGWARLLNYMIIHNPPLEKLLANYVRSNRGEEEYLSLRLMRVYKIGFLLNFYTKSLEKTEGDLKTLTLERIDFWQEVLAHILKDEAVPITFVDDYKKKRDNLRSDEEKRREREFAVA